MMKRITGWLVLVPLCVVLVVFTLANRHAVELRFDPVSALNPLIPPVEIPMFVVIYAMLLLGVVLGGVATWFTQGRQRREKRKWRRRAKRLEQQQSQDGETGSGSTRARLFDAS